MQEKKRGREGEWREGQKKREGEEKNGGRDRKESGGRKERYRVRIIISPHDFRTLEIPSN